MILLVVRRDEMDGNMMHDFGVTWLDLNGTIPTVFGQIESNPEELIFEHSVLGDSKRLGHLVDVIRFANLPIVRSWPPHLRRRIP